MFKPEMTAIQLNYRGPQVVDEGRLPVERMITDHLIEVEVFQSAED